MKRRYDAFTTEVEKLKEERYVHSIPLYWFGLNPDLTVWESTSVYIHDFTDLNLREAADLIGKSVDNLRKTYYTAKYKMRDREIEENREIEERLNLLGEKRSERGEEQMLEVLRRMYDEAE